MCTPLHDNGVCVYGVAPKKLAHFLYPLTSYALTSSSNIDRFSKLFHYLNPENIVTSVATPQVCGYTTLWDVSVLKATIENKITL